MSKTPPKETAAGKEVSNFTLVVKYEKEIYKAGKMTVQFTFRGDQQMKFYKAVNEVVGLLLTFAVEAKQYAISEFAIYDNRAVARPYPENIIVKKIGDIIVHDNSSIYPKQVSELLLKYKIL